VLKKYWRKLLAPVLITVILFILLIYQLVLALALTAFTAEWWPLVLCLLYGGACCVSAYVLWERIKEIGSGEEDDLSQY